MTPGGRRPWPLPDQRGRLAVVTGADSGIGQATACRLAEAGAYVVLACRHRARGTSALARLRERVAADRLELRRIDLADLSSVREFARRWDHDRLDLLVNNAGIALVPYRRTADGFEAHLGVNHLGTFALTLLMLRHLARSADPRVVTVASEAHRLCRFRPDRLGAQDGYRPSSAYLASKRANVYFAAELQRRCDAAGLPLRSVAAVPGLTRSNILHSDEHRGRRGLTGTLLPPLVRLLGKPTAAGALPTLYAATAPGVPGGGYVAPRGPLQQRGAPALRRERAMEDREAAGRLWTWSEQATGVRYGEEIGRWR